MPENHAEGTPAQERRPAKKAKKAAAFPPRRPKPAGVFDSVIAGADEVAENAFKAQAGARPFDAATPSGAVPTAAELPVQQQSPLSLITTVPTAPPRPQAEQHPAVEAPAPTPGISKPVESVVDVAAAPAASAPVPAPPAPAPEPAPAAASAPAPSASVPVPVPAPAPVPVPAPEPAPVLAPAPEVEVVDTAGEAPRTSAAASEVAKGESASGRKRPKRKEWAHQAVRESFADAKISSHTWGMHGFRIVPDVLANLKKRVARDRRTSGNSQLAIGHYLDAALRHAPSEIDEQVASAQGFLAERMGFVEAGLQSTYRIGPQAQAFAAELNLALQEANYSRKGVYVISAAVTELLRALDAEGDLQRPQLPSV